jgi:hypothetical protein
MIEVNKRVTHSMRKAGIRNNGHDFILISVSEMFCFRDVADHRLKIRPRLESE